MSYGSLTSVCPNICLIHEAREREGKHTRKTLNLISWMSLLFFSLGIKTTLPKIGYKMVFLKAICQYCLYLAFHPSLGVSFESVLVSPVCFLLVTFCVFMLTRNTGLPALTWPLFVSEGLLPLFGILHGPNITEHHDQPWPAKCLWRGHLPGTLSPYFFHSLPLNFKFNSGTLGM